MKEERKLKRQIIDIVTKFEEDQMWITPDLISVALESELLIITLRGITSQAEKNLAKQSDGRMLLVELYDRLFDSAKQLLERTITETMGRDVEHSSLNIHPDTGQGVMMFTLACVALSNSEEQL